jgi:hypothetical protein
MEEEKKEHEHEHTHAQEHPKKTNFTDKIRENPWILSTIICGALIIILLAATLSGNFTGNVVSKEKAADNLMNYLQNNIDSTITLVSVSEENGLYLANVEYQGQEIPVYITKDGSSYTTTLVPLVESSSQAQQTTEIPKADKPSVELYVFTYCPYGTQMEKAILPAVKLLGDKIDFKIRQIGAMHGEYEEIEAKRQLCIEKNYPDKFLDYVSAFIGDAAIGACNGDATCLTPKLNAIYSNMGIDASKINSCMTTDGVTMYEAEVENAGAKGVTGSPTLIINGVSASASRSPEAVKGVICNAFNDVPSECSTTLSTDQASAGFGTGTSSSSSGSC